MADQSHSHELNSNRFTSPVLTELARAVNTFARKDGITPSPLTSVWALKMSESLPYHRGLNAGLSVAVAVSGKKIVSLGETEVINDCGHLIAMHGETAYDAVVEASPAEPYVALKLQFPPDLLASSLIKLAETGSEALSANSSAIIFCGPLDDTLASPLLRLLESFRDPADAHVIAPLCLQEICYRLLRSDAFSVLRASITDADTKLVRAAQFIETHANREITVAEVASEIAMSPSHFAHRFTALYGQSPMQFRKQVRLESALQHLLKEKTTIAGAAEFAGYANPSQFTRDFKNAFGLAPRQYADAIRSSETSTSPV
ncbi:Bacillibactin transport regulator [Roseibium album]|nr:Bacillibactin transport regulator [Roseibium album]